MRRDAGPANEDVQGIGLLAEPTRWHLYARVADAEGALSREEVAKRSGVPVHTVKFHLDKLVEAGLLEVEFHKLTGRTGPGSGRPSKHYRRSRQEVSVELPPRHYDLLSELFADAIVESTRSGEPVAQVARRAAFDAGRARGQKSMSPEDPPRARLLHALEEGGYEPQVTDTAIMLRNCPFHRMAQRHTAFVCGINLDFVDGILQGSRCEGARARLDPSGERCCVTIADADR
ncbi:helix-turn-helix transcriptional regulator [Nocardiopsis aegyptia]|uniref:helix-turn-helix transcriptional regulator n=1 Tax=Nocardiopsis aegyptia TaxID=220378 RepID=UPI0036724B20